MRRALAIGVMLLAQAPVQVPRQTTHEAAFNANAVAKHGKANKKIAAPVPAEQAVSPAGSEQKGQNQTPENKQVHVIVDRLPDKDTWDKVYICLTGGLVLVAALTFGVLWYQARETARAARAANASAAAVQTEIVLTQRPRITVRNFYFSEMRSTGSFYVPNGIETGSSCNGQFYIVNVGGTQARIREIWCEVYTFERLPMKRPYEGQIGLQQTMVLRPGESVPFVFSKTRPLEAPESQKLGTVSLWLYVLGWIGYTDDLGIYRITAFCRFYDPMKMRFRPVEGEPDYEYSD